MDPTSFSPPPRAFHAGDRLGRYELIRQAARGGMASLWMARQFGNHGFEKVVAIKTILPDYADQTHFRDMFLAEAKIAAAVDHPNVARILDLGECGDLLYLVMEWIEGHTLAELARAVTPISDEAGMAVLLRILSDACAGLHAAHELRDACGEPLSVVHRDVSPTNILIDRYGVARLIDFGVAKPAAAARAGSHPDLLKGKIAYMAPEYVHHRRVDRRADLWAIGVILYRFLTGQAPFPADDKLTALRRIASAEAPPPIPAGVPRSIAAIVERALTPDPQGRIATAAELQEAMEAALIEMRAPTTSQSVAAYLTKHVGDPGAPSDDVLRDTSDESIAEAIEKGVADALRDRAPPLAALSEGPANLHVDDLPLIPRSSMWSRWAFVAVAACAVVAAIAWVRASASASMSRATEVIWSPAPEKLAPALDIVNAVTAAADPSAAVPRREPPPKPRAKAPARPVMPRTESAVDDFGI